MSTGVRTIFFIQHLPRQYEFRIQEANQPQHLYSKEAA